MTHDSDTNALICTGIMTFLISLLVLFLINQCYDIFDLYLSLPFRLVLSLLMTAIGVLIAFLWQRVRRLETQVAYLQGLVDSLEKKMKVL